MGSGMRRAWEGTQAAAERRAELIAQQEEERLTNELLRLPPPPTTEPPAIPSTSQSSSRREQGAGAQAPLLKTPQKSEPRKIDPKKSVWFHKTPGSEENQYVGESYVRIEDDDISGQAPSTRMPSLRRFFEK